MRREIFNKDEFNSLRKKLRNSATKGEKLLWYFVKNSQLGFKFRRQHGIGRYIVDFYCPKAHLVVEVDGFTHAEEHVFEKDELRQKYLESLGLTVRRYSSEQVFNEIQQVLEDLYNLCVQLTAK